ncbi:MAG: gamma-glutamyltransferase [Sinobacterium sp.]|nr:gamma-glutamyltransferase [Sinobacterium sp.]
MGKILNTNGQPNTLSSIKQFTLSACLIALSTFAIATDSIAPEASSGTHTKQAKIAHGHQFMAVTANKYATQAAYNILDKGGSAIDAAIAAQLVLGLVEPQSSGIGGGGFIVHWDEKEQQVQHFDGRETAPSRVDSNHFINKQDKPIEFFDAVIGGYSVGTPGLVAALELAHKKHGKLPWATLFDEAIQLSQQGFIVSKRLNLLSQQISQGKYNLAKDASHQNLANYLLYKGKARPVGSILKNPEYAKTLQLIAQHGSRAFYQGSIADAMVEAVENSSNPGLLNLDDLKDYNAIQNDAVCQTLRNYKLCGAPAPSSGAISIIQQLIMLDNTPQLAGLGATSPSFYHRLIESAKLSFADRNQFIADPNFTSQDSEALLDISYLKHRSKNINLLRASKDTATAGDINKELGFISAQSLELPSTTHLSIIDSVGNAVSMTSSIETAFGSRIMVKGFILNNQLTDFSFIPKQGNALVANRIEAGKRPRSSMAPMIIFKDNKLNLLIGSPGGARIISYMSKVLAQHLLLDMPLEQAINTPHVSNLNKTHSTVENSTSGKQLALQLNKLGHKTTLKAQTSGIHAIQVQASGYTGIADTRREGAAQGQ